MPVAKIDLLESCSQEEKERLGQELIDTICRTITVPRSRVKVIIHDQIVSQRDGGGMTFIQG